MKHKTLFIAVFISIIGCNSSTDTVPISVVEDTINADVSESLESSLIDRDWVFDPPQLKRTPN